MGIEVQLVSGNSVTKTFLHFTDTYSYWGLKWLFEHQKVRMDAELKVAYNPQTIFMSWNYGDKKFALQLVPSFPIFSIDLLVNWQPKYANLTLKGDVNKGRLEIVANTTTYSFGAAASLSRYQGYNELLVGFGFCQAFNIVFSSEMKFILIDFIFEKPFSHSILL